MATNLFFKFFEKKLKKKNTTGPFGWRSGKVERWKNGMIENI